MSISGTASDIKTMNIRGAGRIAKAASKALSDFASGYNGSDRESFASQLMKAKDVLLSSRPTAVSLFNGVYLTMRGVSRCDSVPDMKKHINGNSVKFISSANEEMGIIAETGSELIEDGDVILTHCNSSAAVGVLKAAHDKGKRFRAFATETRPWGQGFITVTQLADAGVDVTLISDPAVTTVMDHVTKIFVGADTVTSNGSLYNKIGTSQIATVAKVKKKEFYVCAETYKFNPLFRNDDVMVEERDASEILGTHRIPREVKVFNPVFDRTDSKLITRIISGEGAISPKDVRKISMEKFGRKEEW